MNTEYTVKQRLIDFLEAKKISKTEFGRRIGVSAAFVSSMRKSIQPDKIKSIAIEFPELNTEWLLTGEGEMLKTGAAELAEPVQMIPLLPISAQGGTLNDFVVSVKEGDCERVVSPIRGAEFAMTITGDSMAPEYPNGSQILIKKVTSTSFLEWGKVYVLDTCDGSVIKIITPSEEEGCVRCMSINPDQKRYAPFDIPMSDIFGIYRVLLCMSLK